jgi:hypothetical protein
VREESQLDEMRSAIRGDFERLAERRGEQELMRVGEPESEPESHEDEPPDPAPEDGVAPEPELHAEEVEHRSWLARFLSP